MKQRAFLGIDIGGTNIKLALASPAGRVIVTSMVDTRADEGPEPAFARVAAYLSERLGEGMQLDGCGVACAGLVDPRRGWLLVSPNLPAWDGARLRRIAKRTLRVYSIVDNDANAAAYGEYRRGSGRGSRLFVCLTLGTGVGGGIVGDGQILRGAKNYAGEIGHMTINERGPRCKCGNRGCLETYLSADALVRSARVLGRRDGGPALKSVFAGGTPTPKAIAAAARNGDRAAIAVFRAAAEHLGAGLANVVNILNPDRIAICGGIAAEFGLMRKRVNEVVVQRAFNASAAAVEISPGRLGNNAASIGAALLARDAAEGARS